MMPALVRYEPGVAKRLAFLGCEGGATMTLDDHVMTHALIVCLIIIMEV